MFGGFPARILVVSYVWNSISETLLLASDITYLGIPYFTRF